MRTRTRFAILFAVIGLAVMAIGVAAIYEAVGLDSERRVPSEAEALLSSAARRAVDDKADSAARLEDATGALIAAHRLLAEGRVLAKDALVRLALEVAGILAAVLSAAALAFFLLSRLITRGLDELAAGALEVQADRSRRFGRSSDPDLDAVARALNDLLDLAEEQDRRLAESARLEGWREVASFLAHQLKNPLAAILLAAKNGRLALAGDRNARQPGPSIEIPQGSFDGPGGTGLALESLEIAEIEAERLRALIDRFRDLAPAGLESYGASSSVDLCALLESCASRAERSGASVDIGDAAGPGLELPKKYLVVADQGLLEQAFWNLFVNSIEAAAEKGQRARIEVRLEAEGRAVVAELVDSNRGLAPELIARLGRERFSTKAAGTGLGLILVKRILAAQGGSLELFATEAGGLGARARLPLALPERRTP